VTVALITDALTGGLRGTYRWASAAVTGEHSLAVAVTRGSDACANVWLEPGPVNTERLLATDLDPREAREKGTIDVTPSYVELTIRGTSANAIVLRALRIIVVGRLPAPTGTYLRQSCGGGDLTPRIYDVDLDHPEPVAVPAGVSPPSNLPATRPFPYQVSRADAEVIRAGAHTATCACSWVLDLEYVDGEKTVTRRIDDGGRPFRTLPGALPPNGSTPPPTARSTPNPSLTAPSTPSPPSTSIPSRPSTSPSTSTATS
jgi:hypothetical protein